MKVTNLITKKVLRGIDDINRRCHAMHLPPPPVQFITAEVRDADGTVVEVLTSKSNSWVRNSYNILAQLFLPASGRAGGGAYGAGTLTVSDTTGAARPTGSEENLFYVPTGAMANLINGAATSGLGICVGTSSTAESFEHTNLQAIIASGSAAGNLLYGISNTPVFSYNAGTKKATSVLSRVFTNSSGSSITVAEIGWIIKVNVGADRLVLISRDVLATPVTVNNGQALTITYTSEITYPA